MLVSAAFCGEEGKELRKLLQGAFGMGKNIGAVGAVQAGEVIPVRSRRYGVLASMQVFGELSIDLPTAARNILIRCFGMELTEHRRHQRGASEFGDPRGRQGPGEALGHLLRIGQFQMFEPVAGQTLHVLRAERQQFVPPNSGS